MASRTSLPPSALRPSRPVVPESDGYTATAFDLVLHESVISTGYMSYGTVVPILFPRLVAVVSGPRLPIRDSATGGLERVLPLRPATGAVKSRTVAAIGIAGLVFLCCFAVCLRNCTKRRPSRNEFAYSNRRTRPGYAPRASSVSASCRHSLTRLCSNQRAYGAVLLRLRTPAPPSPALSVMSRTQSYCYSCRSRWNSVPFRNYQQNGFPRHRRTPPPTDRPLPAVLLLSTSLALSSELPLAAGPILQPAWSSHPRYLC